MVEVADPVAQARAFRIELVNQVQELRTQLARAEQRLRTRDAHNEGRHRGRPTSACDYCYVQLGALGG